MTTAAIVVSTGPKRRGAIVLTPQPQRVSARAVALTPARAGVLRALPRTFPRTLPRILLPHGLRAAEPGASPVVGAEPPPSVLGCLAPAHNFAVAELANAARYLVPVAGFGALLAYAQGTTPDRLWGPELARSLARALGRIAAAANVAELLADGKWILWTDGTSVNATDAQIAASSGLGVVPGAYVGHTDLPAGAQDSWSAQALRVLDSLNFSLGSFGMVAGVTGAGAVAAEAIDAGAVATEAEAAALVGRTLPAEMVGAAGVVSPQAATAAARTTLGGWSRVMQILGTRTVSQIPKFAALTAVGVVGVHTIPDVVNTNRAATANATDRGLDAAGRLLQIGIEQGDPRLIQGALDYMLQFQRGAQEPNAWLYAALAFAGGMYLSKK